MTDTDRLEDIISLPATCDQGRALQFVLDLIVDADVDESMTGEGIESYNALSDEDYKKMSDAKQDLFRLACLWAEKRRES